MCGGCRSAEVDIDWYSVGAGEELGDRRRARLDLARAATRMFALSGMTVTADPGMPMLAVKTRTGATQMITRFNALARTTERAGKVVDPLSDAAIDAVQRWDATHG
ncbi:hypothetical protein P3H15_24280 [Rhodococcus sp. T2V]|nr:hypothetical protein [Rhodococcus sp. T2V]